MKKGILNYFEKVESYKIIILNIILGAIASYPVMLAVIFMFGLLVKSNFEEIAIGITIILVTFGIIILSNYLLYKIDKKKAHNKKCVLCLIITTIITLFLAASSFVFTDAWFDIWNTIL